MITSRSIAFVTYLSFPLLLGRLTPPAAGFPTTGFGFRFNSRVVHHKPAYARTWRRRPISSSSEPYPDDTKSATGRRDDSRATGAGRTGLNAGRSQQRTRGHIQKHPTLAAKTSPNAQATRNAVESTLERPTRERASESRRGVAERVGRPRRRAPAPTQPAAVSQATPLDETDAKSRRVREILDEYFTTASPAKNCPPGKRMRVRGVNMYYKDTGRRRARSHGGEDEPTFVLLHGLAGSTASWDEVVGDLSKHGRVVSFDRPGFGKTERVLPPSGLPWQLCPQTLGENPYSASFASKAMFGILDRLGVDKVILVSHSLGAQVALRAARTRPEMVRAMILVSPAVLNPLDARLVLGRDPIRSLFTPITDLRSQVELTAKVAAFNFQLLRPGEAALDAVRNLTLNDDLETRVRRNFHDPSIMTNKPELIAKYVEPLKDPLWDRGLLHFYRTLPGDMQPGGKLLQSTSEAWRGPCLVITGDNDPTVPTQLSVHVAEEMEGKLVVLDSCSHIPMDEKSEAFASAVLSFAESEEVRSAWLGDGNSTRVWM